MNRNASHEPADGMADGDSPMQQLATLNGIAREMDRGSPKDRVPRIVITRGRGAGRDEAIGTQCLIGRADDADIALPDRRVSRRHAAITRRGDTYVVHDLGSCNGTIVNGRRVRSVVLSDLDVILLGPVELLFRLQAPAERSNRRARSW